MRVPEAPESGDPTAAYERLKARFGLAARLDAARYLLFWDSQTYMPSAAAPGRGEQSAALAEVVHGLLTAPEVADWLAEADDAGLTGDDLINLRAMRRLHAHRAGVPGSLATAKARLTSRLGVAWREAKATNDWALFADGFKELLSVHREIAAAKSQALGLAPYDALMDMTDPGITSAVADPVFDALEKSLPQLLAEARDAQARRGAPLALDGKVTPERQRALFDRLMGIIGLPPERVRLDRSAHAFTMAAVPGDVRITYMLIEGSFWTGVRTTLHESGHAMYELNLPGEWAYQPLGSPRGATTHESQALMMEMQIGRSPGFIGFLAPLLREAFDGEEEAWEPANLVRHAHQLSDGLSRTASDEISYPLHVLLRYRIEQALLSGDLDVDDVPGAWADLSQSLLGVRPPDHARGALQDFHWSAGYFGYFPSYALGAATAAQLFQAAVGEDASILPALEQGDFGPYFGWVKPRVHAHASRLTFDELIRQASGRSLSADALTARLRQRYVDDASV